MLRIKAILKLIPIVNVISTIWDVVELTTSLYSHFFNTEFPLSPTIDTNPYGVIDTVDDLTPPELRK